MSTDIKLVAVGGGTAIIPLDTDGTMAANSDLRVPTQKSVVTAISTALSAASPTELDFLDGATAGTQVASKAVIADANVNIGATKVTALHIGATGSETQVTSTAAELNILDGVLATTAEINRACDVSTRVVSLTGTAAITEALHEGKIGVITGSGAAYTYTLPEATGSGATYRFIMNEVNTSNTIFTTADAANCAFYGSVNILDKDAATQAAYAPAATDEIMTLNGTTTGGAIGDFIQFTDMATDKWCVTGQLQCPTGSNPATPFSGA